jgi:hypothetical protein
VNKYYLMPIVLALVVILGISVACAKPAVFEVSDLDISPAEVVSGESTMVEADIENIGGSEGTYTVTLKIDGMDMKTKKVTLAAGAKKTVAFTVTKDTPGIYEVELEGLSGTLTVLKLERGIPIPSPDHPGNVFLVGEEVTVEVMSKIQGQAVSWQVLDDNSAVVRYGIISRDQLGTTPSVKVGELEIGWYRIEFLDSDGKCTNWTTAAVLAQLAEPVPEDSPVCVDVAISWFAKNDPVGQERFAQLAALSGVNWVRDRIHWFEFPSQFVGTTTYDTAAELQALHGLKILQVFCDTPRWATVEELDGKDAAKRFPRNLRMLYEFCKSMAQRYKGYILAWEPWNEANLTDFGGHTIDEISTHQKAAYLGFKAGDPNLIVCWNPYGYHWEPYAYLESRIYTEGVLKNEAWQYFDTYNIHSYYTPDEYLQQFETARTAACGRPIWFTECGINLPPENEYPWGELSPENERRQAEFIAHSYASGLFAGVDYHFYHILSNHIWVGAWQYGLLRYDQTPRPGYVALATVGRLLAGAEVIGRWLPDNRSPLRVYAFRARPDGIARDVLVVWSSISVEWALPEGIQIEAAFDYLGRSLGKQVPETIDSAAVFLLLPLNEAQKLPLEAPPSPSVFLTGEPSSIVLQLQMPHTDTVLDEQAHMVEPGVETDLTIFVYNFSDKPVSGVITLESLPLGWKLEPDSWQVTIEPMGRKQLIAHFTMPVDGDSVLSGDWVKLRGDFTDAGQPVLAFRLIGKPD